MEKKKVYTAIGLMSGTSLDGEIDVALLETDGQSHVKVLDFYNHSYDIAARDEVRACFGKRAPDAQTKAAEAWVTDIHIDAVKASGFQADIIGFHGQTITHDPAAGFTWQLGDGACLAAGTGMDVVNDFRSADVQNGGEGAPLLPLYHAARIAAQGLELPVVILNIGGVANVTCVRGDKIIAFDTGPGNALMDDFSFMRTGHRYDHDGALAAVGTVHENLIEKWLDHEYFYKQPPKSLDRNQWQGIIDRDLGGVSTEDGLATLMAFTVAAIDKADTEHLHAAAQWYACGGGRHNRALMKKLNETLPGGVQAVEALGWNGDAIEAEGFAYLAVRSTLNLPLSMPETTGVQSPVTGGILSKALKKETINYG